MSFVITVPAPVTGDASIDAGTFWPAVAPERMREEHRIDGTVTALRLRAALIEAIAGVNVELSPWRQSHLGAGCATLSDVPADEIDGISILVQRYLRAVGCLAKALLLERYRDYDSTARGDKKADALTDPIDDLRRDARWAISDILGVGRATVDLI